MLIDANEDGWQDIFVACDATPSMLLMNNRDGTFREEATLRGVALGPSGEVLGGMGAGIGDYDLDGHVDLLQVGRIISHTWCWNLHAIMTTTNQK